MYLIKVGKYYFFSTFQYKSEQVKGKFAHFNLWPVDSYSGDNIDRDNNDNTAFGKYLETIIAF